MVGRKSLSLHGNEALGSALRRERQARHLSIPAVAQALNIPSTQLLALEEGDFSVFAAEVYARGAYLKYALYVGMDFNHAQNEIVRALASVRQHLPLKVHTPYSWFERLVMPRVIMVASIAFVGLMIGGYIAWQIQSYFHLPMLVVTSPTTNIAVASVLPIVGKSDPATRINVNGEQVLLKPDASFAATITLHPGVNIVRIEATNAAGRTRVVAKQILWWRNWHNL